MHREFESPEELRDVIPCFWYDRMEFGEELTNFTVMPDGYTEIIFHFGGNCSISDNGSFRELPSPFIMGLLNQPAVFYARNCLEIIGVRCYPWTVFDLLGLPPGKNSLQTFEHPIAEFQSVLKELIEAGKIEEAVAQLNHFFTNARAHVSVGSMLNKAGIAMKKANGKIPVSEVAMTAHTTVRTLERNFKQSSGHTVKDVSGLMRFEQVRNQLWHYPDSNLAGLAHDLGYTDQSHLTREFRRYSGTTPAAFARKAKREGFVKDDFAGFSAD